MRSASTPGATTLVIGPEPSSRQRGDDRLEVAKADELGAVGWWSTSEPIAVFGVEAAHGPTRRSCSWSRPYGSPQ